MTNPPPKQEPINIVLRLILLMMVIVPTAICYTFFFGKLWGSVVLTVNLVLLPFLMRLLSRRRKTSEAESFRRIDKAIGKPSNDPRQMARWVP